MAKLKFSPILSDARGAVGGSVFSRNASGPYVKANSMPTNARTLKSLAARALFGAISSCWRTKTWIEQNSWNTTATTLPQYNSMGEEFFYTGFQLFMQRNMNLAGIGIGNIIDTPGAQPDWPTIITGTSSLLIIGDDVEGVLVLNINATPMLSPLSQFQLEIMVTPYISLGITRPKESLFRRVGYYTAWGTEVEYEDSFWSAVGVWIDGNWMFVRLYIIDTVSGARTLFYETTISELTPP